jgi:hypothetical protein
MDDLIKEKTKVLAERNSWSLAHAKGYVDGQIFRRRGMEPSKHAQIGIDEYSQGFRAGYYDRKAPAESMPSKTVAVPVSKPVKDPAKGAHEL